MGVAVLTGRCWSALVSSSVPGSVPLPDDHIVLAGVRDLDDGERELLAASAITLVAPDGLGADTESEFVISLDRLAVRTDAVHLHVDLDVIDVHDGLANEFAVAGGPPLHLLEASIRAVADRCPVGSVSLTSFNPAADPDERAFAGPCDYWRHWPRSRRRADRAAGRRERRSPAAPAVLLRTATPRPPGRRAHQGRPGHGRRPRPPRRRPLLAMAVAAVIVDVSFGLLIGGPAPAFAMLVLIIALVVRTRRHRRDSEVGQQTLPASGHGTDDHAAAVR